MLQFLNMSIVQSATELISGSETHQHDDDQLEKNVLLCRPTSYACNLCVFTGLINGAVE